MKDGLIINVEICVKENLLKFYDNELKGVYENNY